MSNMTRRAALALATLPNHATAQSTDKKHVFIIGAGPQGLATGIQLIEQGCAVTILEANPTLGQGISWRPDFNQYGTLHSGVYYPPETKRAQLCHQMHHALNRPSADTAVMKVFRQHIRGGNDNNGKVIIARTDGGVTNLNIFQKRLENSKSAVKHSILKQPDEIKALNEPTLGDPRNIKAALHLSNVGIIHISDYIGGLHKKFQEMGGSILLSHEVIGAQNLRTETGKYSLGLICKTPDGQKTIPADVVINMAGLYVLPVAKALRTVFNDEALPALPPVRYDRYFALVEKNRDPEDKTRPTTRRVVYVANPTAMTGPNSTVGVHSFCSDELSTGRYALTFGNYMVQNVGLEKIGDKNPAPPAITEEWWQQAEAVYPGLDRSKYELALIGRIGIPLPPNGERDFFYVPYGNGQIINCFTGDSPGLTCSPQIAQDVAAMALHAPALF